MSAPTYRCAKCGASERCDGPPTIRTRDAAKRRLLARCHYAGHECELQYAAAGFGFTRPQGMGEEQ